MMQAKGTFATHLGHKIFSSLSHICTFLFISFSIRRHLMNKLMQNLINFNTVLWWVMHHTAFSLKEMKKNNHFDYGKFQICIENENIKKLKTSAQKKIINKWSDVLGNANFVPIFQIWNLPSSKCLFTKIKFNCTW